MLNSQDITDGTTRTHATQRVAEMLSRALDTGDLGTVGRLLSPDCECEDGAVYARGAESVLAFYRVAASWAERGFDEVRHSSEVEHASGVAARAAVTTYVMRVPGRWHRLQHAREISVNPSGRVVKIVHSCQAAAAVAFRAFVRDCGTSPPPAGFGT